MKLVKLDAREIPLSLGPMGPNGSTGAELGVQLDDGSVARTGVQLVSGSWSDYSGSASWWQTVRLFACASGWLLEVVLTEREMGIADVEREPRRWFSRDGRAWEPAGADVKAGMLVDETQS